MKILRFELSLLSRKLLYTCTCSCVDARGVKIFSPSPFQAVLRALPTRHPVELMDLFPALSAILCHLDSPRLVLSVLSDLEVLSVLALSQIILLNPRSRNLCLRLSLRRLSEGHLISRWTWPFSGSFVLTTNCFEEGLQPWRSLLVSWKT